jgi:hypothetical protein
VGLGFLLCCRLYGGLEIGIPEIINVLKINAPVVSSLSKVFKCTKLLRYHN